MFKMLKKFVSDERGLETVEYALMAGVFIVGLALVIGALRTAVEGRFQGAADELNPAV